MTAKEVRERLEQSALSRFPALVRAAFDALFEAETLPHTAYRDSEITLTFTACASVITLTLTGAQRAPKDFAGLDSKDVTISYSEENKQFSLLVSFLCGKGKEDVDIISFTDAAVAVKPYNAAELLLVTNEPFDMLTNSAKLITSRRKFGEDMLCQKEKELLPLLSELVLLDDDSGIEDCCGKSFPCIMEIAAEHGDTKLIKQLRGIEKHPLRKETMRHYRSCTHGRVWSVIFAKLKDSQSDYPPAADIYPGAADTEVLRQRITQEMHRQGFRGEFPDFTLTDSKGRLCAAVYCAQKFSPGDGLTVQFIVYRHKSTNRLPADLSLAVFEYYSQCRFVNLSADKTKSEASQRAVLVKKLAARQKLTKELKRMYYSEPMSLGTWLWLIGTAAAVSFLLGLVITIGMDLFDALLTLFSGDISQIAKCFADIPGDTLSFGVGFFAALIILFAILKIKDRFDMRP